MVARLSSHNCMFEKKPAYTRESVYFILMHEIMATISSPKLIIKDKAWNVLTAPPPPERKNEPMKKSL